MTPNSERIRVLVTRGQASVSTTGHLTTDHITLDHVFPVGARVLVRYQSETMPMVFRKAQVVDVTRFQCTVVLQELLLEPVPVLN